MLIKKIREDIANKYPYSRWKQHENCTTHSNIQTWLTCLLQTVFSVLAPANVSSCWGQLWSLVVTSYNVILIYLGINTRQGRR